MNFCRQKWIFLSIQFVLFSGHAILLEQQVSWTFFMEYTIKVVGKVSNTDQTI